METNTNYLLIATLGIKLYEGNIVALDNYPDIRFIVRHGWFVYEGRYYKGWHFASFDGKQIVPAIQDDLVNVTLLSTISDQEGPTAPVNPEEPKEPYEPAEYLNEPFFPVSEDQILKLVEGSLVTIESVPNDRWILQKGWYNFDNNLHSGWYLISVTTRTIRPVIPQEIDTMAIVSTNYGDFSQDYLIAKPTEPEDVEQSQVFPTFTLPGSYTSPHGPLFPPVAPNTENFPYWFESAFVTFDTIEDLDRELDKHKIPDGKMVRINNVDGEVKYYAYNFNNDDWDEVNFVFAERKVIAGDGLSGGGTLSSDITLSHDRTGTGESKTYSTIVTSEKIETIDTVSVDKFGHISDATTRDITQNIIDIASESQPRWHVIEESDTEW